MSIRKSRKRPFPPQNHLSTGFSITLSTAFESYPHFIHRVFHNPLNFRKPSSAQHKFTITANCCSLPKPSQLPYFIVSESSYKFSHCTIYRYTFCASCVFSCPFFPVYSPTNRPFGLAFSPCLWYSNCGRGTRCKQKTTFPKVKELIYAEIHIYHR